MASYKITLSQANWIGGTAEFWYDTVTQSFFADSDLTTEISSVTAPSRELYHFNGFYSASSGGTQYIDSDGGFTSALYDLAITSARTFYAQGSQVSWKLTLGANGSGGTDGALYQNIGDGQYYADWLCETEPVATVPVPEYAGHAFAGYYNTSAGGGAQYIDQSGALTESLTSLSLTASKTIYAKWVAPYKITISPNSGTGGTSAFWFDSVSGKFFLDANLTEETTSITPPTRTSYAFAGCRASNNDTSDLRADADGSIVSGWAPAAAATIYARWTQVSWKCTINKQSGTGGTDALWYRIDGGGWYEDNLHRASDAVGVRVRRRVQRHGILRDALHRQGWRVHRGLRRADAYGGQDHLRALAAMPQDHAQPQRRRWRERRLLVQRGGGRVLLGRGVHDGHKLRDAADARVLRVRRILQLRGGNGAVHGRKRRLHRHA